MYGSGVRTGGAVIQAEPRLTLRALPAAPTVSCVAVVGTATRGAAGCRSVTSTPLTTGTTSAVSVFASVYKQFIPSVAMSTSPLRSGRSEPAPAYSGTLGRVRPERNGVACPVFLIDH